MTRSPTADFSQRYLHVVIAKQECGDIEVLRHAPQMWQHRNLKTIRRGSVDKGGLDRLVQHPHHLRAGDAEAPCKFGNRYPHRNRRTRPAVSLGSHQQAEKDGERGIALGERRESRPSLNMRMPAQK